MANQTDLEHALYLDESDPLRDLRQEFIIPSIADLKRTKLVPFHLSSRSPNAWPARSTKREKSFIPSTYLCGNSLGLQPRLTSTYLSHYLSTWATKGVYGHFKPISDSPLVPFVDVDDAVTSGISRLVGALPSEVAVMQTLTANLHLLLTTFYRPTAERHKIILESRAFPSDHYAIESHLKHHHRSPSTSMICIEPPAGTATLPTAHILATIRAHAPDTALVLLPGIQYYTGQLLDMPTITAAVHALGLPIGWDLAHAVANVPLALHAWHVDFAVWCSYKYLNCGPGCAGGLFVHNRHSTLTSPLPPGDDASTTTTTTNSAAAVVATGDNDDDGDDGSSASFTLQRTAQERAQGYVNRLSGWWGSSKRTRFAMENAFEPLPGAAGWQVSNPSMADLTSVAASLAVFAKTDMHAVRAKSVRLTGWLEELLVRSPGYVGEMEGLEGSGGKGLFCIITPRDPEQRGAQLSLLLREGLLDPVMEVLEEESCVVDERRPNVVRVAPAPLYNTFEDVRRFVEVWEHALDRAVAGRKEGKEKAGGGSLMVHGGKDSREWSEIK